MARLRNRQTFLIRLILILPSFMWIRSIEDAAHNHSPPITMMYRWNPLSLLCEACGEKKRCRDQAQPCFNYMQRNTRVDTLYKVPSSRRPEGLSSVSSYWQRSNSYSPGYPGFTLANILSHLWIAYANLFSGGRQKVPISSIRTWTIQPQR